MHEQLDWIVEAAMIRINLIFALRKYRQVKKLNVRQKLKTRIRTGGTMYFYLAWFTCWPCLLIEKCVDFLLRNNYGQEKGQGSSARREDQNVPWKRIFIGLCVVLKDAGITASLCFLLYAVVTIQGSIFPWHAAMLCGVIAIVFNLLVGAGNRYARALLYIMMVTAPTSEGRSLLLVYAVRVTLEGPGSNMASNAARLVAMANCAYEASSGGRTKDLAKEQASLARNLMRSMTRGVKETFLLWKNRGMMVYDAQKKAVDWLEKKLISKVHLMRSKSEEVGKSLAFRMNVESSFTVHEDKMTWKKEQIFAEAKKVINQLYNIHFWAMAAITFAPNVIAFWMLLEALWYLVRYLKIAEYDNIYVNTAFRKFNMIQMRAGEQSVLPVPMDDRARYVVGDYASPWMKHGERTVFYIGLIAIFLVAIKITGVCVLEFIVTTLSYHVHQGLMESQFDVRSQQLVSVNFSGPGRLADKYGSLLGLNEKSDFVLPEVCTDPVKWTEITVYKHLANLMGVCLVLNFLNVWFRRMRHKACDNLFPERVRPRAVALWNDIRVSCGTLQQYLEAKITAAKTGKQLPPMPSLYEKILWKLPAFVRLIPGVYSRPKYCDKCHRKGDVKDIENFGHCWNTKCNAVYCLKCIRELAEGQCKKCKTVINVVDADELDIEQDPKFRKRSGTPKKEDRSKSGKLKRRIRRLIDPKDVAWQSLVRVGWVLYFILGVAFSIYVIYVDIGRIKDEIEEYNRGGGDVVV